MKLRISYLLLPVALVLSTMSPAFAADTAPPQLVDWNLVEYKTDISKGDAAVRVRFVISDESEVIAPNLLLKSLSSTQLTSFATVKELSRAGKLISYEASAVIKYGQSPRIWEWVIYPLRDSLGNASNSFGPSGNWKSQVAVIDSSYNDEIWTCEGILESWNKQVENFQVLENKYPGSQEIAIARLKYKIPIVNLALDLCASQAFQAKYFKDINLPTYIVAEPSGLKNLITDLKNVLIEKAELELVAKELAAEKTAADKAAADKAAADKAAADKAAADKAAADKAAAKPVAREKTIICLKGKSSLKVIGKNPKCPAGFK